MNMDYLEKLVAQIPTTVIQDIIKVIENNLNRCCLYYRIFGRSKSPSSTTIKLSSKNYQGQKKMQDLLGVRVALYFKDDIAICREIIENTFIIDNITKDEEKIDTFSPTRLNYVCRLPETNQYDIPKELYEKYPIDTTFEIQLRTIFSEGWHEIEHDLRYKSNADWKGNNDLSRALNGIFATLETCDWSILNVFEELSYRKYKEKDWGAMLKNKLRIHFIDEKINKEIDELLNGNPSIAKELLRVDRHELLLSLSNKRIINFPKTLNNVIFTINELYIGNSTLHDLAPKVLCDQIDFLKKQLQLDVV